MKRAISAVATLCGIVALAVLGLRSAPQDCRISSFSTSLNGRNFSQRHNALLSAKRVDGFVVPSGGEFSFNARVGSYSSDMGYRKAPVSFDGRLIDDWGGGVCQTSTTIYNAALLAGMRILERHPHRFCPSYIPPGRDAAVAYRWVDLRFRNPYQFPVRLQARVDDNQVRVDFYSPQPLKQAPQVAGKILDETPPETYTMGRPGPAARLRNSGKAGYEVAVYRFIGNRRELVSEDDYPAMNRLIEYP